MLKNEKTVGEILEELKAFGFAIPEATLRKMTCSEVRKYYRKAKKIYSMTLSLEEMTANL